MKQAIAMICLVFLSVLKATSQPAADTVNAKPGTQLKIGVFYNSYLHYYGRTDSLESGGIFPVAELWAGEHFYLTAAPVFVTGKEQNMQYAGTVVMAGFRTGKENVSSWNFYVVKPLYKANSSLVQSALKVQAAASGTWLNKIMNLTLGGDVKLSDDLDYGLQLGGDHIFRFGLPASSILVLDPSFYINAGTQQFSKTYQKQSSFLFFPGMQEEVIEQVTAFNVLSYEFSMPVVFAKGKMQFIVSPSYVVPQNLLGEKGKNKFYGLVGAKFTL